MVVLTASHCAIGLDPDEFLVSFDPVASNEEGGPVGMLLPATAFTHPDYGDSGGPHFLGAYGGNPGTAPQLP